MAEDRRVPWLAFLPPLIFAALAGMFLVGLYREDPNELPTALKGRFVPDFTVHEISGLPPFDPAAMKKSGVKLVNFWASWCGPCRLEHEQLMTLAAEGVPIYGINNKDRPEAAKDFLAELGDPYVAVGADPNGRAGFEWGVYGIPETFVVDGQGRVLFRHPGPITSEVLRSKLRPAIEAAKTEMEAAS